MNEADAVELWNRRSSSRGRGDTEQRDAMVRAFVVGAKWWEFESTGATMWQSDQARAEAEAIGRYDRDPEHPFMTALEIAKAFATAMGAAAPALGDPK